MLTNRFTRNNVSRNCHGMATSLRLITIKGFNTELRISNGTRQTRCATQRNSNSLMADDEVTHHQSKYDTEWCCLKLQTRALHRSPDVHIWCSTNWTSSSWSFLFHWRTKKWTTQDGFCYLVLLRSCDNARILRSIVTYRLTSIFSPYHEFWRRSQEKGAILCNSEYCAMYLHPARKHFYEDEMPNTKWCNTIGWWAKQNRSCMQDRICKARNLWFVTRLIQFQIGLSPM